VTVVLGILLDLDGVVRLWHDAGSRAAETAHGLPSGAIARLAYDGRFDLAHHGLLTHEQWVAGVRERLIAEFGPDTAAAVELWAADRGQINQPVVDLVRRLRAAGLRVGMLTNNTSILDRDLATHEIADLADVVVNSAEVGVCKPAPAAYRIAAARLGLPLTAVAFADDDATNVEAAAALGMPAHRYTDPDSLTAWVTTLGITLPATQPSPVAPTPQPASTLIDQVLAPLGIVAAPPAAAAESDLHSANHHIRYLATALRPNEVARYLNELTAVAAALADGSSVAVMLGDGSATEVRLLPPDADGCLAAGHPAAWIPAGTTVYTNVEYLPPWTTGSRRQARIQTRHLAGIAAWNLTQLAAAHHRADPIAAAAALDRARATTTAISAMLARHQPLPAPVPWRVAISSAEPSPGSSRPGKPIPSPPTASLTPRPRSWPNCGTSGIPPCTSSAPTCPGPGTS
jgi:putative hydrolase of the HAD superfamily